MVYWRSRRCSIRLLAIFSTELRAGVWVWVWVWVWVCTHIPYIPTQTHKFVFVFVCVCVYAAASGTRDVYTHIIHIYIRARVHLLVCVCVCVCVCILRFRVRTNREHGRHFFFSCFGYARTGSLDVIFFLFFFSFAFSAASGTHKRGAWTGFLPFCYSSSAFSGKPSIKKKSPPLRYCIYEIYWATDVSDFCYFFFLRVSGRALAMGRWLPRGCGHWYAGGS